MTQESTHHPSGPLLLAVALAMVAGFVDAHIYLAVSPIFVANMSGNLVHIGMLVGDGNWWQAVGAAAAVVAFATGVIVSIVEHDRRLRRWGHLRPEVLLAVESVLLVAVAVLRSRHGVGFHPRLTGSAIPIVVVAAAAMGVQAATLRRVGDVAVSTTYGTGAIVRIGEKVALAGRRAGRSSAHRRRLTVLVLATVLVSYVAGAAVAAALGSSKWLLFLPAGVLVVSTAVVAAGSPTTVSGDGSAVP